MAKTVTSKSILILEDSSDQLMIYQKFLEKENLQVFSCGEGKDIPIFLNNIRYDLIIADFYLDGIEFAELMEMKQQSINKNSPLVLISGVDQDLVAPYSGKILRHFQKPVQKKDLVEFIHELTASGQSKT